MTCLCGTNAGTFLSCLRRALGVAPDAKWDAPAHTALYNALSTLINVQSDRSQTAEQIRIVLYGSESEITGIYAGNYPTRYLPASSDFWRCVSITRDEAAAQAASGSGPYYDAMIAVMNHVRGSEEGSGDKSTGTPWWLWVLGGVAVGAGVYLAVRD